MRQVLQNLGTGETMLVAVPMPVVLPGTLLIETRRTLVSPGTERMLVEFGKSSLIEKARKNPERVKQVMAKARADGILPAIEAVRSKLNQPLPLGYCNTGVVLAVGDGVTGFRVGDRVASNGPHAEIVRVAGNLSACIPMGVNDDLASFTVISAIGLQGIRLVDPTLGETVVVIGLGLIGLITVQLLIANGCKVIGIDPNVARCELAQSFGAETIVLASDADPVAMVKDATGGRGADAVIIAAATESNAPIEQAAQMCRQRGRIVLVGVVGLNLSRDLFYQKELTFQVSCSYGPGRYDSDYENRGRDYPIGFVRWTARRNFEAILALIADGKLDLAPLVTHRFDLDDAVAAYNAVADDALGVLLRYPEPSADSDDRRARTITVGDAPGAQKGALSAGFIGFGNFASRVLAPAFKKAGIDLNTVVSTGAPTAATTGRSLGFRRISTDPETVFGNPEVGIVALATRHDDHAAGVIRSLEAGKAVFVEKPLATTREQVDAITAAYEAAAASGRVPQLMVGFNRRFAPHVVAMKSWLDQRREPATLMLLMNAGALPADHWTQDPHSGGGRIIGEACHLVDLARFLIGSPFAGVSGTGMWKPDGPAVPDNVHITISFADGSTAVINYLANGSSEFVKERVEVFCGGEIVVLDNYRSLKGYSTKRPSHQRSWRQDKGHLACVEAFARAVAEGSGSPIPFQELVEVAVACIAITEQVTLVG